MERLPARAGWQWVKEGFRLLRKQPAEMAMLMFTYMLALLVIGMIPLVGQIAPLVLVPVFAMTFMEAGARLDSGERISPMLLSYGFKLPVFKTLLRLGSLYILVALAAAGVAMLIDDGTYMTLMTKSDEVSVEELRASNAVLTMMCAGLTYALGTLLLWYAAPLVAWHNMGVGKAVFYSFYAVRYNFGAFVLYGLGWFGLALVPSLLGSLLVAVTGMGFVARVLSMTVLLMLVVAMYCSFYPTYSTVFGRRPAPSKPPAQLPL